MKTTISLILISLITFLTRVLGQLDQVFVNGAVLFRGQDAWYHVRLAAYMAEHFPHGLVHDFFVNPMGEPITGWPPILTYLIATPKVIFGLSEHQMEIWAAFLPPILASLTVIILYFLAYEIFRNKGYAFIATLLFALLPTEFYHRSMLGFTDHHILEVLFTLASLLFILKVEHQRLFWLPLGFSLGGLYASWAGAAYIHIILLAYVIFRIFRYYHTRRDPLKYAIYYSSATALAACIFILTIRYNASQFANEVALLLNLMIPIVLAGLATLLGKRRKVFYWGTLGGGAILLGCLCIILPIQDMFLGIFEYGVTDVISERAALSIPVVTSTLGLTALLAIVGFVFYLRDKQQALITVFTIPMLAATVCQLRYEYYLIISVAILTTYCIKIISKYFNAKSALVVVMVFFAILPSVTNIIRLATYENDIDYSMYEALAWLRQTSPEPYQDVPNAFYDIPEYTADYQVLSWWDYGAWITYIAHRAPLTTPMGLYYNEMSSFFITGDLEALTRTAEKLYGTGNVHIKYIVINDWMLASDWIYWANDTTVLPFLNKLWYEETEYPLVYKNETVKIFEVK